MNHDICPHGTDITEHTCAKCDGDSMLWKFTLDDFLFYSQDKLTDIEKECAEMSLRSANAKLSEWMKDTVAVYNLGNEVVWTTYQHLDHKLQALLIKIQPIEKKCEKHEPSNNSFSKLTSIELMGKIAFTCECKHCGLPIQPSGWKAAE